MLRVWFFSGQTDSKEDTIIRSKITNIQTALFVMTFALIAAAWLGAGTAQAGTSWAEDWASHAPNPADGTKPPSSYWNFHTFNLYPDRDNPTLPPSTDSYSFVANPPNGNTLVMRGSGWGLETRQHFSQGAPISVETVLRLEALTPNTPTFAGISIYDGESGNYEDIALVDYSSNNSSMAVWHANKTIQAQLPSSGSFLNEGLNHGNSYKLRLEYDGRGNWNFYAWDMSTMQGGYLTTVSGSPLTSAPDIFILGVALEANLHQNVGDPSHLFQAQFQNINVRGSYNLFAETSWVDFLNTADTQNINNTAVSPNTYYQTDTNNTACNGGANWYDPADNLDWPQCDVIGLAHMGPGSPPDNFGNPFYSNGWINTAPIDLPDPDSNWGEVLFTTALGGAATDVYVQVLDSGGSVIGDQYLPGNASGFRSSPLRLGGLDPAVFPSIRLKASFSTSNPAVSPKLYDWTLTFGKKSFFSWYDMQSAGMKDWLLMSNAAMYSTSSHFQTQLGAPGVGASSYNVANPNTSAVQIFPGMMDGPLMVNNLSGLPQVVSQRMLLGDSLEETLSIPQDKLSDHYYWTWYDMQTPGYKDWVVIANPDYTNSVYYEIRMPGVDIDTTPGAKGVIPPGGRATPMFPGVIGGPVEVQAWKDSTKLTGSAEVMASQRVLMFGDSAFNEVNGIPASELTNEYLWTWYDQQSPGATNWVLLANPGASPVNYQISIAGGCDNGDAASCQYGTLQPAGDAEGRDRVIPTFPGVMGGSVEVTADGNIIASQRILWGNSFEEVPGYDTAALSSAYHWTWYDQQSAGARNWVLVANPNATSVFYEIKVGGVVRSSGTIAAGGRVIPTFGGVMGGPVQVEAWTDSSRVTAADVFASQRVLWKGHLNEVLGTVLE